MEGAALRIGIIIVGVVLIAVSVWMNSFKKLVVNHAVIWAFAGAIMVLVGAVPVFSGWMSRLAPGTGLAFFCMVILALVVEMQNSVAISQMTMKNRELAMHVALLNQENERIMEELEEMRRAEDDAYEKDRGYEASEGFGTEG